MTKKCVMCGKKFKPGRVNAVVCGADCRRRKQRNCLPVAEKERRAKARQKRIEQREIKEAKIRAKKAETRAKIRAKKMAKKEQAKAEYIKERTKKCVICGQVFVAKTIISSACENRACKMEHAKKIATKSRIKARKKNKNVREKAKKKLIGRPTDSGCSTANGFAYFVVHEALNIRDKTTRNYVKNID